MPLNLKTYSHGNVRDESIQWHSVMESHQKKTGGITLPNREKNQWQPQKVPQKLKQRRYQTLPCQRGKEEINNPLDRHVVKNHQQITQTPFKTLNEPLQQQIDTNNHLKKYYYFFVPLIQIQNKTQQEMEQNIEWKEIKNFPKYEVSNTGLVRNKKTLRVLQPRIKNKNIFTVNLQRDGDKPMNQTISRLVAFHFLENPNNSNIVRHKSKNFQDNSLQNLYFQ
ncbi:hypothetical protein ABPG72_018593 [Tetrahymena utriculariae]